MLPDALMHAGALVELLLALGCAAIFVLGIWITRNPAGFWDQFNPYLKPYSRFTLGLGRLIGSLWAAGAFLGCILFIGNAIQAGLHHRWINWIK
jgi:hypothetical protein